MGEGHCFCGARNKLVNMTYIQSMFEGIYMYVVDTSAFLSIRITWIGSIVMLVQF